MRTDRRALFRSLLSFITENGIFIIMRTVRMYGNCYIACQEIPEDELRELDVQNTVSQIMRGSDFPFFRFS